jgi:hypothetical protein
MNEILRRLREEPNRVGQFVNLLVEDLLSRPVRQIVDPAWLAPRFVEGFRATVKESRTEQWVQAQVATALSRAQKEAGTLRERVPVELIVPAKQLASRAYQPDRILVRAILDHKAMHKLLREVLLQTLTEFGRSLKPASGAGRPPKKRGAFGQLLGAATDVASVVGGAMEKQVEGKVREFVDGAIHRSLDLTVNAVCAEDFVPDFAEWRAGILDSLLDVDFEKYLDEIEKLDPDGLVNEISALLRGLAAWEGLGDQVESLLVAVVEEAGDARLRDFLAGSGLEEEWRPQVEEFLVDRARDFVSTDAFGDWLEELSRP